MAILKSQQGIFPGGRGCRIGYEKAGITFSRVGTVSCVVVCELANEQFRLGAYSLIDALGAGAGSSFCYLECWRGRRIL